MGVWEALQAYKEVGVAALFISMYLATIWKFINELKESRAFQTAMMKEMTEKVIIALESSKQTNNEYNRMAAEVKVTIDQNTRHSIEFLAFLKGRDGESAP
jgi:hypothetical protein